MRLVQLDERYIENLQIGLVAWMRVDTALQRPSHVTKIVGLRSDS